MIRLPSNRNRDRNGNRIGDGPWRCRRVRSPGLVLLLLAVPSCRANEPEPPRAIRNPLAVHLNELGPVPEDRRIPQWRVEPPERRERERPAGEHGHFYLGGNFGLTDGNESAGDLQNDINRRGPASRSVAVDLDDTDVGYKVFLGYRFVQPFAVELGYTGLEGPDSTIRTNAVDADLIGDIHDLHPVTGRGPSLALVAYPVRCGRFDLFARIGVWYWEADVRVNVGNIEVRNDPNGLDPIIGLGAQYRLFSRVRARLEYERYFLGNSEVDLLSLGLTVGF